MFRGKRNNSGLRLVGALGVALLVFNLALVLLNWPPAAGLDRDTFVWRTKLERLDRGDLRRTRILILGDSQSMSGVLPRTLATDDGAVYNLGLPALQPEGLAAILSAMDVDLPDLQRVVVNVSPFSLFHSEIHVSFRGYARRELWRRRPTALLRHPYLMKNPAGLAEHLAAWLPLYRMRDVLPGIRMQAGEFHAGAVRTSWNPYRDFERRRQDNRRIAALLAAGAGYWSWNYVGAQLRGCPDDTPPARKFDRLLTYRDRPHAVRAWGDVLRTLRARTRARIYLVQLPLSRTWHNATNAAQVYQRLDGQVQAWQAEFPWLKVIARPDPAEYTGRDFIDWTHLSYCGAAKYSADLKRALDADRDL